MIYRAYLSWVLTLEDHGLNLALQESRVFPRHDRTMPQLSSGKAKFSSAFALSAWDLHTKQRVHLSSVLPYFWWSLPLLSVWWLKCLSPAFFVTNPSLLQIKLQPWPWIFMKSPEQLKAPWDQSPVLNSAVSVARVERWDLSHTAQQSHLYVSRRWPCSNCSLLNRRSCPEAARWGMSSELEPHSGLNSQCFGKVSISLGLKQECFYHLLLWHLLSLPAVTSPL